MDGDRMHVGECDMSNTTRDSSEHTTHDDSLQQHPQHDLQDEENSVPVMSPASPPSPQPTLSRKRRRSQTLSDDVPHREPPAHAYSTTLESSSDDEFHKDDDPFGDSPAGVYSTSSDSSDDGSQANDVAPYDAPRASRASSTPPPGLDVHVETKVKTRRVRNRRKDHSRCWRKCYMPQIKSAASPSSENLGRLLDMIEDRSRVVAIRSQRSVVSPRVPRPQHALQHVAVATPRTPAHNSRTNS